MKNKEIIKKLKLLIEILEAIDKNNITGQEKTINEVRIKEETRELLSAYETGIKKKL